MKNFIKLLGIIALVAVIGFSFASCDNGSTDSGGGGEGGGGGNALNGTYNSADGSRIVMNNGSFTLYENNVEIAKGTYTSGNAITMTFTQYKGSFLNENGFDFMNLSSSQWYNQQQLRTAIIEYFKSLGIS
jgi:hypothetical protein